MSPLLLTLLLFLAPASTFAADKMSPEEVQKLALQYADLYGVPHGIVLRTVKRESRFDPAARNGPYWGLMQIRYDTAKGVGYRGSATGLLDPETNLTYGVAYLANAYMIAGGNESMTHRLYRSGYYYAAKRKKLLAKLITAPPTTTPLVLVAAAAPPVDASPLDEAPIPVPKPLIVAEIAPSDAEPPASVPLPIAKPKVAADAPATAPEPIVAKPQVVLASVLPEPHLSLSFGRDPNPASAAAMAIATQMEPVAPEELAVGVPLPRPNPLLEAAAGPEVTAPVRDFTAAYFDIEVKILPPMPMPRPRPVVTAGSTPKPTVVAFSASLRPKPRPVE